ncbi:MAG: entericidin [Rhizobiaceae bacterium]|nr:entericidin [Rhizobiaceae bacterium]
MSTTFKRLAAVLAIVAFTAGCANTIRGLGRDGANAVNAVEDAGNELATAAE